MKWFVGILLASLIATAAEGGEYVWLEGEKPSSQNYPCGPAGVERPQFLSGERWLMASLEPAKVEKDCPKEGILIGYDFQAPSAGNYEIWNRIGMEFARSPFEWRIDQRAWQTISPQDLTCDLMEVGFWNEVAWIQMGRQEVAAGLHTLQIRLRPSYKEEQGKKVFDKILYCSDALCISKAPFRPNGKFKPDADWQTESDKNAAVQVFKIDPATSSPAERIETPLGGEWQACRFDEQEVVEPRRTDQDAARHGLGALDVDRCAGQQVRGQARAAVLSPNGLSHAGRRARGAGRTLVRPAATVAKPDRQRPRERPVLRLDQSALCRLGVRYHACGPSRPGERGLRRGQGLLLRDQREKGGQELPPLV